MITACAICKSCTRFAILLRRNSLTCGPVCEQSHVRRMGIKRASFVNATLRAKRRRKVLRPHPIEKGQ